MPANGWISAKESPPGGRGAHPRRRGGHMLRPIIPAFHLSPSADRYGRGGGGGVMSTVARRTLLTTLGAGFAAPAILRAQARSKRSPIAFSTLGCPSWSWKTILET